MTKKYHLQIHSVRKLFFDVETSIRDQTVERLAQISMIFVDGKLIGGARELGLLLNVNKP